MVFIALVLSPYIVMVFLQSGTPGKAKILASVIVELRFFWYRSTKLHSPYTPIGD